MGHLSCAVRLGVVKPKNRVNPASASRCRADILVCWLAELSSSAARDWKAAHTRRLESLRYLAASPASVSGLRRAVTAQFTMLQNEHGCGDFQENSGSSRKN
jgi:hypothetical protein